jgi:hypothetical protein
VNQVRTLGVAAISADVPLISGIASSVRPIFSAVRALSGIGQQVIDLIGVNNAEQGRSTTKSGVFRLFPRLTGEWVHAARVSSILP